MKHLILSIFLSFATLIQGQPLGSFFLKGNSIPNFNPADIIGLKLWLDSDGTNLKTKTAADFNGTTQYLSSTSTSLKKGNTSFSYGLWFKANVLVSGRGLIGNFQAGASSTDRGYGIRIENSGELTAQINDGTSGQFVYSGVSPNVDDWIFVVSVYDAVADLLKISVNGDSFVETAWANGSNINAGDFNLGALNSSTWLLDGQLDLPFFYDKALSLSEVQALYNGGNATYYAALKCTQKVSLVSWWSLSERSGTRYDQHKNNHLTDNNNVGFDLGYINQQVVNNSFLNLWNDKSSTSNNATQSIAINQPNWLVSSPSVNFDFTTNNQFLNINSVKTDLATTTTGTWSGWFKFSDATPASVMGIINFGDTDENSFIYGGLLTDGKFRFKQRIGGVDNWSLETDAAIANDDSWVHIAVIQDGVSPVIKIDNVEVAQTFSINNDKTTWFNNDSGLDNGNIGILNYNNTNIIPLKGEIQQLEIYNTNLSDEDLTKIYQSNPPVIMATGGVITMFDEYKIHTFNSSDIFEVTSLGTDTLFGSSIEYLIVGGGGGGGYETAGGGGAGGVLQGVGLAVLKSRYDIAVGSGGAGAVSNSTGSNGNNSEVFCLKAIGGGSGGRSLNSIDSIPAQGTNTGKNGGSGGGGKRGLNAGGLSLDSQGNDGGQGGPSSGGNVACAGGGGGAGAVGQAGATRGTGYGGNGGIGIESDISGASIYYAGGGGGGTYEDLDLRFGLGGEGGGGRAASRNILAVAGTANTGGGGGGGQLNNAGDVTKYRGAAGGSGVVIIRYKFK